MERLKANINKEIEENDIEIYQFPDCDSDEDEDFQDQDRTLKNSIPFAIVSATHVLEVRLQGYISILSQYLFFQRKIQSSQSKIKFLFRLAGRKFDVGNIPGGLLKLITLNILISPF